MKPLLQRASAMVEGAVINEFTDRPWRSKTVRFAALVVVIGMGFWIKHAFQGNTDSASGGGIHFNQPVPWYARLGISYIGGFLIGWTFRRFIRITFLIVCSVIALMAFAKFAGCDGTAFRTRVEHEAETAREKAREQRDYLKRLLPSGTAAGVGVFWGFWRRSRGMAAPPPPDVNSATSPPPPGP